MPYIKIKVEVNNPQEVIQNEKGKWVGLASRLLSLERRKEKVEEELYESLKEELQLILPDKLEKRGIEANIKVELIEE